MAYGFLSGDRDQQFLLPPDMKDWVPVDHPVWVLIELVGEFDLREFFVLARDPRGRRRYDPALLVTLIMYAYLVGERSSRQIERRCYEDVAFRIAAANMAPDHTTISRFMTDHKKAFDRLFVQVLRLARDLGMVQLGTVFLDGTKLAANASPLAAKTADTIAEEIKRITEEVERITDEARRVDEAEDAQFGDRRGDELPEDLADPVARRQKLDQVRKARQKAERAARHRADRVERLQAGAERVAQDQAADAQRSPSKRRKSPHKANVTDPDCRVMKGPRSYFWAYNAQAVVSEDGFIIAADVSDVGTDNHLFDPMIDQACQTADSLDLTRPRTAVADNGYWTDNNAGPITDPNQHTDTTGRRKPTPYIAAPTKKNRPKLPTDEPIPEGASIAQIMERELRTENGRKIYKKRAPTIEPVFSEVKAERGIRMFRRRGLDAARHEWQLIMTTHNLKKLMRHLTTERNLAATQPAIA